MTFRILGIDPTPFLPLYGLDDGALAAAGVRRYRVDRPAAFPDRVEMRDLEPGETALLVNHTHQSADTPYRASHAIFVREGATQPYAAVGEVPDVLRTRTLSVRAFDAAHMMVDADLADGCALEATIARMFGRQEVAYLQVHYARRGCYAARVERA